MPYFEELVPQNNRQQSNWEKKRQEVYAVSLNHFMRAFYRGQIHEEGFFVIDPYVLENVYTPPSDNVPAIQTETSWMITNERERAMQEAYEKLRARLAERERQKQISDLLSDYRRMIETTPSTTLEMVSESVISSLAQKNTAQPKQNFVQVTIQDSLILVCLSKPAADLKGKTTSVPVMAGLLPQQFALFSDGSYTGLLKMQEYRDNSISLSALSSTLPVEYAETTQHTSYDPAVSGRLQEAPLRLAEENMATQLKGWPQEKLHLHTDRDFYVPGEKIWFKAYLTDAQTHQSSISSRYVYVELISPVDTLVHRVMVRPEEGMFYGYLPITKIVPEGDYTLRAYTRYMENLGDDYFFKKNIRIGNLKGGSSASLTGRRGNLDNLKNLAANHGSDYDVSFFPEGGNLPEGVLCKVAFKALNRTGYAESVTGYLIDEAGAEIKPVETYHAGMGVFNYVPETGKKYRMKCINGNGLEKVFDLPQPDFRAYTLTASMQNDRIRIGVQKSVNSAYMPCYLLIHCRGTILFFSAWDGQQPISLPTPDFPAGVIQIVLFDGQMNPLSERLIFSSNEAAVPVDFHTDKGTYRISDRIVATLSLPDAFSFGHFSVAVTDDRDIAVDESVTILSSLLLSSELKGYIENPAYYLHDPFAMDLLMMTHGWRRYNVPEVVRGKTAIPHIPHQTGYAFAGSVKSYLFPRPVAGSEVLIAAGQDVGLTSTDENGRFAFQGFEYPDSTDYFIQALSRRGSSSVKLAVDDESFPPLIRTAKPFVKTKDMEAIDKSVENTFLVKE